MVLFILVIIVEMLFSLILTQKTYHQYEVKELAKQLSGLASSPIKKPIDLQVNKRLQNVVNSINLLVSNTNQHIKEQRESEKSKDELITNVSHDIRTPLTSIIGYLGLIESDNYQSIEQFLKYTHIAYKKIIGNAKSS
jgi:Signal transduction histidine kinase